MRCVLALVLLCGSVLVTGQKNLVAETGKTFDGFVDIELRWEHGETRSGVLYQIYIRSPTGEWTNEGSTKDVKFTIEKKEFWTTYEIIVEATNDTDSSLRTHFYTGPGAPHRIRRVRSQLDGGKVRIEIEEASMPRLVDQYLIEYCSLPCVNKVIVRKQQNLSQPITAVLDELELGYWYPIRITPEIESEDISYEGLTYFTVFYTKAQKIPEPEKPNEFGSAADSRSTRLPGLDSAPEQWRESFGWSRTALDVPAFKPPETVIPKIPIAPPISRWRRRRVTALSESAIVIIVALAATWALVEVVVKSRARERRPYIPSQTV